MADTIIVEVEVAAPLEQVWQLYTEPAHIVKWCFASPEWHAPKAVNEVSVGGAFKTRMEAKDGSEGFDVTGTYTAVQEPTLLEYTLDDGRKVSVQFSASENKSRIVVSFEPEHENPRQLQQQGWQAILDNFKRYVES